MNPTQQSHSARLMTLKELAELVRGYRALRSWTQEELAEIASLNVETIEQVEAQQHSDPETRRALAAAFDFEDIDIFNQPINIPVRGEAQEESETFDSEHVTLEAFVLTTGEELAQLVLESDALIVSPSFEMGMQADKVFEALADYAHEYRELAQGASEAQKIAIYEELHEYVLELSSLGVSVSYAVLPRTEQSGNAILGTGSKALLYLVAFPRGEEPESFLASRNPRV